MKVHVPRHLGFLPDHLESIPGTWSRHFPTPQSAANTENLLASSLTFMLPQFSANFVFPESARPPGSVQVCFGEWHISRGGKAEQKGPRASVLSRGAAPGSLGIRRFASDLLANGSAVGQLRHRVLSAQMREWTAARRRALAAEVAPGPPGSLTLAPSPPGQVRGAHPGFVFPTMTSVWMLPIKLGQAASPHHQCRHHHPGIFPACLLPTVANSTNGPLPSAMCQVLC